MQKLSNKFYFVLIFLHLAITIPLALKLNIWVDEASTLYNTQHGFFATFDNVFHTEKQAPLYFLGLSLLRTLDDSIFFARLVSIICSCLAIKVFWDLAGKFFDENTTILTTTFFALHPFLIWISLEIRLYTLTVLFVCLLLKLFYEGYLESRKSSQYLYILTAIIGLYINYYLGFLLVGGMAILLSLRHWETAKKYFVQMFLIVIGIIPLIWMIKIQLATNQGGHKEVSEIIDGVRILWSHFVTIIMPTELMPTSEQTFVSYIRIGIVRFGLLAFIVFAAKKKFRFVDEKVLIFGIFAFTVAAFMLFAYSLLGGAYLALRHSSVLFVPLILFIGSLIHNVLPRISWKILAVLIMLLFPYSIYKSYPTFAKRGDWKNIAAFIEANEKPNQIIITSQVYDAISLPYHYKGAAKVLPDERFFEWNMEDSFKSENAFKRQTEFIISKIPPDTQEIWLLTRDGCHLPETAPSCRPLENFVDANYTIEIEKDFYLEKLRLLKRK